MAFAEMDYIEVTDATGHVRRFSRIFMGTDHLAQSDWVQQGIPAASKEEIFRILDEAVRNGINVIDTSPIYVNGIERIVGEWLESRQDLIQSDDFYVHKDLNPDRKIYILSKGGFPFDLYWSRKLPEGSVAPELVRELAKQNILLKNGKMENVPAGTYASRLYGSPDEIANRVFEELHHTLSNLNGALTIYLFHRDAFDSLNFEVIGSEKTPVADIAKAINSAPFKGKFALLGVSNWTTERIREFQELSAKDPSLIRLLFNSPYFSLFEMSGERSTHARLIQVTHQDLMDPNFQNGIFLSPYSPLGGFSILDRAGASWQTAKKEARSKYLADDPYWRNVYHSIFTDENEIRYERARALAQKLSTGDQKVTVDQVVNAYALAHQRLDFVTVGPITIDQVRRTVAALSIAKQLRPADLDFLYRVNQTDLERFRARKSHRTARVAACKEMFSQL